MKRARAKAPPVRPKKPASPGRYNHIVEVGSVSFRREPEMTSSCEGWVWGVLTVNNRDFAAMAPDSQTTRSYQGQMRVATLLEPTEDPGLKFLEMQIVKICCPPNARKHDRFALAGEDLVNLGATAAA